MALNRSRPAEKRCPIFRVVAVVCSMNSAATAHRNKSPVAAWQRPTEMDRRYRHVTFYVVQFSLQDISFWLQVGASGDRPQRQERPMIRLCAALYGAAMFHSCQAQGWSA
jgi:hypothetical protein